MPARSPARSTKSRRKTTAIARSSGLRSMLSCRARRGLTNPNQGLAMPAPFQADSLLFRGMDFAHECDEPKGKAIMTTITAMADSARKPIYQSLFVQVLAALLLGIVIGMAAPEF